MNKKGKKWLQKVLPPAFWYAKHPKAGQNTEQTIMVIFITFNKIFLTIIILSGV